ncbi:alpha/beta fold hydrolase [Actinomadura darangshiensis]|uniref:Alpha/beta fold hydrolase n=1 Tax=Actinomadura darangshiensis TaxID=705336 RepID=A0A4R5BP05_9ACTN|nr:alpha/beta fold hydrolase [Actinomadura darangshiensis]TDD85722.1 alpha/beta fold hydrolase [Actinomadura darangshiensis]
MRSRLTAVFALGLALAASGGATAAAAPQAPEPARPSGPKLTDPHPCADEPGFTCSFLTVPLDHRRPRAKDALKLQVATAGNTGAPKGVLLFLTGGPGQPGAPFIGGISQRMPELATNYRFVMVDQRGTGEFGAIDCPRLQAEVDGSDIEPPSPAAVKECAGVLGDRRHYFTTEQTAGDLDLLRQALGVRKWTVDGVSYGTMTGATYAALHPGNVNRLVLDSVLPFVDPQHDDMLYLTGQRATARVLRDACETAPACGFDPAEDLAWLARHRDDAVLIWDMLVSYEFADPSYRDASALGGLGDVVSAIHDARNGDPAHLDRLLQALDSGGGDIAEYSSGLHIATICGDGHFPWGTSETPPAFRKAALERTRKHLPARATWPFTADTAVGNGFVQECLHWPWARHTAEPHRAKLSVPVLLVNGDHDLSTPLEWARETLRYAPRGRLVVVKGASHSIQNRERGTQGREAVSAFLLG